MVHFYFDTSAIVKRYHKEPGSDVVDRIFDAKEEKAFVTSYWTVLEFLVACSWKYSRKELTKKAFNVAVANFLKDLTDHFAVRSVNDELVAKALPLGVKYGLIGSADCLQLATALELKEFLEDVEGRLVLVSADSDLCKAAKQERLEVINPREKDALKQAEKALAER